MENISYSTNRLQTMKTPLLFALLAGATYIYFHNSPSTTPAGITAVTRPGGNVSVPAVTIAAAPSSYDRWNTGLNAQTNLKTGPNAQTDLKTGPNAQTDFQPFAPSEHATWNQTAGSTIVSGGNVRGRGASGRTLRLR
jgi:hypothetical protein